MASSAGNVSVWTAHMASSADNVSVWTAHMASNAGNGAHCWLLCL